MNKKDKDAFKITCSTCNIELNIDLIGERCPRCNSVIYPAKCSNCTKSCMEEN